MDAPPPYMPPKKKSNTGLIIGLVIGGVVLCCIAPVAVFGGLAYFGIKTALPFAGCGMAFSDARDAARQYAKDHDGKLPSVDNWQDELRPYYDKIVSEQVQERGPIKSMPSSGAWGCEDGSGGRTGMAYNEEAAGKNFQDVATADTVIFFEVPQQAQNAHSKYEAQPEANSPKVFGQPRGWFLVRAYGDAMVIEKGREKPMPTRSMRTNTSG